MISAFMAGGFALSTMSEIVIIRTNGLEKGGYKQRVDKGEPVLMLPGMIVPNL